MANHKSAAKRARQTIRKNTVNSRRLSTVRTFEKNLLAAIEKRSIKDLPGLLSEFASQIAKAAKTGVLKKETMSRKISRLSTRVSQLVKGN